MIYAPILAKLLKENEDVPLQPITYYKVRITHQVWSGEDQRDIGGEERVIPACHPFLEFNMWPFPCKLIEVVFSDDTVLTEEEIKKRERHREYLKLKKEFESDIDD